MVKHVPTDEDDMHEVAVGEHGSLGLTRRSRCIDDGGQVVGLDLGDSLVKLLIRDGLPEVAHRVQATRLEVEDILELG